MLIVLVVLKHVGLYACQSFTEPRKSGIENASFLSVVPKISMRKTAEERKISFQQQKTLYLDKSHR